MLSYKQNVFIYAEVIEHRNKVQHIYFDTPLDQTRVDFPYDYQTSHRSITKFELDCCNIVERNYTDKWRYFDFGSFFPLPVSTQVEKMIHATYNRKVCNNQEIANQHFILKAIGIDLAQQKYQEYLQLKELLQTELQISQDVGTHILLPYITEEISDISTCFSSLSSLSFNDLKSLDAEWQIVFCNEHGKQARCYPTYRHNYYNDKNDYRIGLFVAVETVGQYLGMSSGLPLTMQFIFCSKDKIYYSTEWMDCPDWQVLINAYNTINDIEWPQ